MAATSGPPAIPALLRYTGSGWNQVESGTRQNLYSISGSSSSSLWAVGGGGTFLHYGGLYWTLEIVGRTARPLYGLAGYSNTQSRTIGSALAVGEQGTVLRYTGADWVTDPTLSNLTPASSTPSPSQVPARSGSSAMRGRWSDAIKPLPFPTTADYGGR